jgi:DNA-binding response OmpR family regulator
MPETTRETVLVVDDTEANIDILVETLGDDYEVSVALDGREALEMVAEERPGLILLDVMMPEMDGYEVCRRLKADEATQDIPVLFITALSEAEDEARGLGLGAIDYITKPFNPAIVKARVRNHLALREAARLREDVERIMRHDLKSPLTAVVSLPQLLCMADNLEEHQREMLGRIEEAGYILLSMVNLSTALFKMERGGYALDPEPMDLAAVVRKVFAGVEDTAAMRGMALVLEIDGAEAAPDQAFDAVGEELLCYSMLANLVSNALDASPRGEAVRVGLDRDGESVRVAVVNAGAVPEAVRERFFEKYATAGKSRGTGLGTYSARLIARAHGGDIAMQSEGGVVTVTVTLPLRPAAG